MVKKLLVAGLLLSSSLVFGQVSTDDLIHGRTYAAEVTHEFVTPRDTNCLDLHTYLSALFGVVGYTPPAGAICYDLDDLVLRCYNGVNWTACGSGTTTDAAANTLLASNGSGGLSAVAAIQSLASGNAIKRSGRYEDTDSNGDGTIDTRIVRDYNGDGLLTPSSDINTAVNNFCDLNNDGTQDDKGLNTDLDGDGTLDKVCGTVIVDSGVWTETAVPSASPIRIKWSGLTFGGAAPDSVSLIAGFSRAAWCALPGGVSFPMVSVDFADYVTVQNLTIKGIGERTTTFGASGDCDMDGTAAENYENAMQAVTVSSYNNDLDSDGTQDDSERGKHNSLRNIRMIGCDTSCVYFLDQMDGVVEDITCDGFGEHCFAFHGNDRLRVDGVLAEDWGGIQASATNAGGYGIEVFGGNNNRDNQDCQITNVIARRTRTGVMVLGGPGGTIENIRISNVTATDLSDALVGDSIAHGVAIQASAGGLVSIKNVRLSGIHVDRVEADCININAGGTVTYPNVISGVSVTDFSCRRFNTQTYTKAGGDNGAVTIKPADNGLYGTVDNIAISHGDIELDGTTTVGGVISYGSNVAVSELNIHGSLVPGGHRYSAIYEADGDGTGTTQNPSVSITDNVIDLDNDDTSALDVVGVRIRASNAYIDHNVITMNGRDDKLPIQLDGSNPPINNIVATNNVVIGGDCSLCTSNWSSTTFQDITIAGNYLNPTYNAAGAAGLSIQATRGRIMNNLCKGVTSQQCFAFPSGTNVSIWDFDNQSTVPGTPANSHNVSASGGSLRFFNDYDGDNTVNTQIFLGRQDLNLDGTYDAQSICGEGLTEDSSEGCDVWSDVTADRTWTKPDASGTYGVVTGTSTGILVANGTDAASGVIADPDLAWDATNNRFTLGPSGYCGLDTPPGGAACDAPPWGGRTLTTSYIRKNGVDYMLWIDWDHDSSTSGADTCFIGEGEAVGGSGISTDCTGQTGSILHFRRVTNGGRDYPLLQSGVGNGNGANLGLAVGYTIDPTAGPAGAIKLELEDVNGAFGGVPDLYDYVGWGGGGTSNTPYWGTDVSPFYQIATNKIMLEGATKDAIDIFIAPDDPIGTDPQQTIPTYSGSIAYGLFEQTADVTVANQAAETTLLGSGNGSVTINGSVLRNGSTLTINASGFHGALANADPQIRIALGGTTFCDTGATLDVPATTAQAWFASCTITIRGAPGAAVAVHGQGSFEFFSATGTSKRFSTAKTSTSNLATNGALSVTVTVDWDAASATNTITATNLTVSAIR